MAEEIQPDLTYAVSSTRHFSSVPYIFSLYRTVSSVAYAVLTPYKNLKVSTSLEPKATWLQFLGQPTAPRPHGTLVWFHAASLGEGAAAMPIIEHCLAGSTCVDTVLLTTRSWSTLKLWEQTLPSNIVCQLAPLDSPNAVRGFLGHWRPEAAFFMESELWPNLLCSPLLSKIPVILLNGRMSETSFLRWNSTQLRPLIQMMLQRFDAVAPMNNQNAIRLQLLGASPTSIRFCGDLKYGALAILAAISLAHKRIHCPALNCHPATSLAAASECPALLADKEDLLQQIEGRQLWLAASTHSGEEEVVGGIHTKLKKQFPRLLTIISPRHPHRMLEITKVLSVLGLIVSIRSRKDPIRSDTDVYLADTLGELRSLYRVCPIAFVGGSLFPNMKGHNFLEATMAGCATITGPHVGHFSQTISDLKQHDSKSIIQVSSKEDLCSNLFILLSDSGELGARRNAARISSSTVAHNVLERVRKLVDSILRRRK